MPFVVDASVAACWVLPGEQDAVADAARRCIGEQVAWAPALWWFEFRNMLVVNERRGRIGAEDTRSALALMDTFAVRLDRNPDERTLLTLARRHRLTVYDAAYLELALRETMPLATLDMQLANAAQTERVALIGRP